MKKIVDNDVEIDEPKPKRGAKDYAEEMVEKSPKKSGYWHGFGGKKK